MKPLHTFGFFFLISIFTLPYLNSQSLNMGPQNINSWLSTSGSFSIVPVDSWGSGDFNALTDKWFGYDTPRLDQLSVSMDQTASTTYEGELFFKKLRLKAGLNMDVDDNLIGKINRFMGYINYQGFTLRIQKSELRGTAEWSGSPVDAMPKESRFENPFISIDLLYYRQTGGMDYFGMGYMSYHLPVQLDILTYDPLKESVWWNWDPVAAYQPDMAFHIYSVLFGLDTLYEAFTGTGTFKDMRGFMVWMATQDRAGLGVSYIGEDVKTWMETESGKTLWSTTQIAMLVDYNLILGLQWVGGFGSVRLGMGLGFEAGGQLVECITPKGPVDSPDYIDASPSLYLFHYGPILKGMVSW